MLELYREDPDKQESGSPIYVDDSTFWVKRWGTRSSFEEQRQLKNKLFGPLHKFTPYDDWVLIAHWLAEYGVTNWELVTDGGKELKFTRKNAREIFLDESFYRSLNEKLFTFANNYENYLFEAAQEELEDVKKP